MPSAGDVDRYEAYYADKLWALLPEIYRAYDSNDPDQKGPLREIVDRIGVQAAILRRSIDRAWEDQSIESCDDWVIPYLADLLATRIVASLDARGQRLDVARSVYYRRRKGTLAVLEQLSADITGWDARVVEMFRRLGRARHGLDFEIGWPLPDDAGSAALAREDAQRIHGHYTRTPTFGTAHLKSPHGARLQGTAFDEFSYTADMRLGAGRAGWYNIPRLGVFLWRLHSYPVEGVTPVAVKDCPAQFSFDPTGRKIPLFATSTRAYGDAWVAPTEQQLPGPISRLLFFEAKDDFYAIIDQKNNSSIMPRSLAIYREGDDGYLTLIEAEEITGDPADNEKRTYVDPEQGLLFLAGGIEPERPPVVAYHYGFSSSIGAGPYDRRAPGQVAPFTGTVVRGGGEALGDALITAGRNGTLLLGDSRTYTSVANIDVTALTLRADNHRRPLIRLPDEDPGAAVWAINGTEEGSRLVLDGLFVSGGDIRLTGQFESVTLTSCTLDPGELVPDGSSYALAVDGRRLVPCRLVITGQVKELIIDRSITGSIVVDSGAVELMRITDSVIQGLAGGKPALDAGPLGLVELQRSTLLGPSFMHRLEATSSILHEESQVADAQHSCLRYCAWAEGSALPRKFESHMIPPRAPIFASTRFGQPAYAALAPLPPAGLADGAEDGSEIGAFSRERTPIKERSLRIKLREYMPAGVSPVVIYVT